jgi:hypothetical protein
MLPIEILKFLGLQAYGSVWAEQFPTLEAMFDYATTCRLFWVRPEEDAVEDPTGHVPGGHYSSGSSGEIDRGRLKANDRRRMAQRPAFARWVEEYLPHCRKEGRFQEQTTTRDDVREQAFRSFGIEDAYMAKLMDWNREKGAIEVWAAIKAAVPEDDNNSHHWRSMCCAAFKKIVLKDDRSLGIYPSQPIKDANGLYLIPTIVQFVEDNWEEVGNVAWTQNCQLFKKRKVQEEQAVLQGATMGAI